MLSPFAQSLLDYIKAGYPALAVVTHEEERLLADLRTLAEAEWNHATWTVTRGWVDAEGRALNQGQGNPRAAIQALSQLPERTLAVLFDLHPYLGQFPEVLRALRDSFELAKSSKRPLLLCSPDLRLPIELQKDVALLDYPLPSRDTLRQLLGELLEGVSRTLPEPLIESILNAARGLTWNEAENAFALALIRDQHAPERMPATVQREKTMLVRKQGVLDLLDPQEALGAVGGLGPLKAWLEAQGDLLAQAATALAWGFRPGDLPKGVLLVGIPGCLRGDARVLLADGRMPTFEALAREVSDTLEPGEYDVALHVALPGGTSALATRLQIHPARDTVLIRFADGRELEATPDHEVLTTTGWRAAGDLIPGDRAVLWEGPCPRPAPPKRTRFIHHFQTVRRLKVTPDRLPEMWTPELTELMGLITAEGNKDHCRVVLTLSNQEHELADWLRRRCDGLFGLAPRERKPYGKQVVVFSIPSLAVAANLHPLMLGGAREKTVPEPIFELDDACVGGFLRGVFEGDGTIGGRNRPRGHRNAPEASLKTASVKLARGTQLLLRRLGIPSVLYEDARTKCWRLSVRSLEALERFEERVGFISQQKRDRLRRAVASYIRRTRNHSRDAATVAAVERGRTCDRVYDLSVPGAERFVANGIVVHNCGKSLVARAVAAAWRLPLLRLEMSRVLGSLVGQSEAQTQQALRLAEAMAPAVLHVDEIEKALAGAGAGHLDSGVTSRVVGSLLTWLQERGLGPDGAPAPVFVVATANRVEALPPELFRPGRFDQVFFLDLPEAAERAEVLKIHLAKRRQALPAAQLGALVEATERFSPAECEQLVKTACLAAFRDGGRAVTAEDCLAARQAVTPLAESRAEEIGALREWAWTRAQRANNPAAPSTGRRVLDFDTPRARPS